MKLCPIFHWSGEISSYGSWNVVGNPVFLLALYVYVKADPIKPFCQNDKHGLKMECHLWMMWVLQLEVDLKANSFFLKQTNIESNWLSNATHKKAATLLNLTEKMSY